MSKKIAVSCDEYGHLVRVLLDELRMHGFDPIYFGPGEEEDSHDWPVVTQQAVACISEGTAKEAVVMCWTGTGCTIAANKMSGIRAALCQDAATAQGARIWNHANVLALSLRTTSESVLKEILEAWFTTPYRDDEWNALQIRRVNAMDNEKTM